MICLNNLALTRVTRVSATNEPRLCRLQALSPFWSGQI